MRSLAIFSIACLIATETNAQTENRSFIFGSLGASIYTYSDQVNSNFYNDHSRILATKQPDWQTPPLSIGYMGSAGPYFISASIGYWRCKRSVDIAYSPIQNYFYQNRPDTFEIHAINQQFVGSITQSQIDLDLVGGINVYKYLSLIIGYKITYTGDYAIKGRLTRENIGYVDERRTYYEAIQVEDEAIKHQLIQNLGPSKYFSIGLNQIFTIKKRPTFIRIQAHHLFNDAYLKGRTNFTCTLGTSIFNLSKQKKIES